MTTEHEPPTLVEADPPRAEPTLRDVIAELRQLHDAVVNLSTETARLHERVSDVADEHGRRLRDIERGQHSGNGAAP